MSGVILGLGRLVNLMTEGLIRFSIFISRGGGGAYHSYNKIAPHYTQECNYISVLAHLSYLLSYSVTDYSFLLILVRY